MIIRTTLNHRQVASIVVDGDGPRKKGEAVNEVRAQICTPRGNSRTHANRLYVILTGNGRYHGNSGQWGAVQREGPSATYNEHGEWMAVLYALDPMAVVGPYKNVNDFTVKTGGAFDVPAEVAA